MNGIAGEYLIVVNRMNIADPGAADLSKCKALDGPAEPRR